MEKDKTSKGKGLTVAKAQELMSVNITAADIKTYFCPLANDKELYLALGVIKSLGLNPHTREVHLVKYSANDKLSIIVGYEVYIKRADRTGKLAGWECGITEDGLKAWVRIYRKDWEKPFYWEVVLSEFDKKQATWKAIPTFMGRKVAIAQGFRLCFPDELGGMPYTQEEHQVYDVDAEIKDNPKAGVQMPKAIISEDTTQSEIDKIADESFQAPPPEQKPNPDIIAFQAMMMRYEKAKKVLGDEMYYKILSENGVRHAKDICSLELMQTILDKMSMMANVRANGNKKK